MDERLGAQTIGSSLVGHMFAKLDRATAEQGVEARCPLLDYDLVQYARKLWPELLLHGGKTKALLKAQLHGWPDSFMHRPKLGFAFRLRWTSALSRSRAPRHARHVDARSVRGLAACGVAPPACAVERLRNNASLLVRLEVVGLQSVHAPNESSESFAPERRRSLSDAASLDLHRHARFLELRPRVVKEADALSRAGHEVLVVPYPDMPWTVLWDAELARTRAWTFEAVRSFAAGVRPRYMALQTGVRQRCYRELARRVTFGAGFAERAFSRPFDELVARARAVAADLYVAHNAEALPAAHAAARARGAAWRWTRRTCTQVSKATGERAICGPSCSIFERRCLPACRYVTVPSQQIADEFVERYGIARPVTVHNVFPLTDRARLDGQRRDRRSRASRFIRTRRWWARPRTARRGPRAWPCARLGRAARPRQTRAERRARATSARARAPGQRRLIFHATVHPDGVFARTAQRDMELALERPVSRDRLLTVTNKLFFTCSQASPMRDRDTGAGRNHEDCAGPGLLLRARQRRSARRRTAAFHRSA